ncbi:MAG: acetoacetate decarboxylase family protein [Desulfurivibrionaceae bacterium]
MNSQPTSIIHKGVSVDLPFMVYQATSVSLYSLLDYESASSLCEGENFTPIIIKTDSGEKKAAGVVSAIDYKKTSLVPYLEWSIGIFVAPKGKNIPEIKFTNETSLFFQSILNDVTVGNYVFCPKLILNEPLPTEVGVEYYGYPKELGDIAYNYNQDVSHFTVSPKHDQWIMKASVPTKRGILSKLGFLWAMVKAYGLSTSMKAMTQKYFTVTLLGSAKILAKKANMKVKNDPNTEMFPWCNKDCNLEINSDSKWGKIFTDLKIKPQLVCY